MAFIPDDADERARELTPNARIVYHAHCRFRKHAYRVSFATDETIATAYKLSVGSVKNAHTELKAKGWIRKEAYWTHLLVGDFSPVDEKHPQKPLPIRAVEKPSRNHELPFEESHETVNIHHETMISNHETVNIHHEIVTENHETMISHNKDCARPALPAIATSQDDQHTHTSARARSPGESVAASPRVCVSEISKSKFSKQEIRDYAKVHVDYYGKQLGEGWIKTAWKTGDDDDLIEEFYANGKKVDDEKPKSKWDTALQRVQSRGDGATEESSGVGAATAS